MSNEGVQYRQMPVATYLDSLVPDYDVEIGYRPIQKANYVYIEASNGDHAIMVDLTPDQARALCRDMQEVIRSAEREAPQ